MTQPIELTGSHDLRWALVLSCLSRRAFHLRNIFPEITTSHANLLKFFHALCTGLKCDVKSSTALTFTPGSIVGGNFSFETCRTRGVTYYCEILSALCAFSRDPINVTLFGNTNGAPNDIDIDRFRLCVLPFLANFGVTATVAVLKRGCYPEGGGTVLFKATPLRVLRTVSIVEEGHIRRIRGVAYGCGVHADLAQRTATTAKGVLLSLIPDVEIATDVGSGKDCGPTRSFGLVLVAESVSKSRHAAEAAVEEGAGVQGASDEEEGDVEMRRGVKVRRASGDSRRGGAVAARGRGVKNEMDNSNREGLEGVGMVESVAARAVDALLERVREGGVLDVTHVPLAAVLLACCPDSPCAIVTPPLDGTCARVCSLIRQFLGVTFVTHDQRAPKGTTSPEGEAAAAEVDVVEIAPKRVLFACVGSGLVNTTMRAQ